MFNLCVLYYIVGLHCTIAFISVFQVYSIAESLYNLKKDYYSVIYDVTDNLKLMLQLTYVAYQSFLHLPLYQNNEGKFLLYQI